MNDFKWDEPNTEEAEVDEDTLASLDRAIEAANRGEWYSVEEVREMIPKWISKFATQNPR